MTRDEIIQAYAFGKRDFTGADLRDANLRDANLRRAVLIGADLSGAIGIEQQAVCNEGSITGYKKTTSGVVTLTIPEAARRVNAYGSRKCRAEYAVVVEAPEDARSIHDSDFVYTVGQTVRPDSFDPDPRIECSHGIHFFVTRKEAEEY